MVYNESSINQIVNHIRNISPEKYENYGKNTIVDYAKNMLLKGYLKGSLIHIKEDVYVNWEDFTQLIRFENGQIVQRFIGGLYDIKLTDNIGNYTGRNLYGMLLSDFNP